jgi:hypothetical protein
LGVNVDLSYLEHHFLRHGKVWVLSGGILKVKHDIRKSLFVVLNLIFFVKRNHAFHLKAVAGFELADLELHI